MTRPNELPSDRRSRSWESFALALGLAVTAPPVSHAAKCWSTRRHYGEEAAFQASRRRPGIQVKMFNGARASFSSASRPRERTPADVLLTVDAATSGMRRARALSKVDSPELASTSANLRDQDNRWFGLTVRARTIMYNTTRVKPAELSTTKRSVDAKWRGGPACVPSGYIYKQSLCHHDQTARRARTERSPGAGDHQPVLINSDSKISRRSRPAMRRSMW